ncbi:hypothetical protein Trydic_g20517 [Trypoxylus dichotomus]
MGRGGFEKAYRRYRENPVTTDMPPHDSRGVVLLSMPACTLGKHAAIFQTELLQLQPVSVMARRGYTRKKVDIMAVSWATVTMTNLVNHYKEDLNRLAQENRLFLIWVPGPEATKGNIMADAPSKEDSRGSFM